MALYCTDPYHTILYRMHVYRTVRYRTVLKSKPIRHLCKDNGETSMYRTVRCSTVRHRGRYAWARCTVRDKLRGEMYSAAALVHKHTHSFGMRLYPASWRQDFANYWLISVVVKTCSVCVAIDMGTGVRASLPVPQWSRLMFRYVCLLCVSTILPLSQRCVLF